MTQHVDIIIDRLKMYINSQLNTLSQTNPLIAFTRPLITRVIDNNTYKVESILKQIADRNGMIDVDGILSEMIEGIVNTRPFKIDTKFLGELEIGGGKIKMNLPLVGKDLILNRQDLLKLRDTLNNTTNLTVNNNE